MVVIKESPKIERKYTFTDLLVYGVIIVVMIIIFMMGISFVVGGAGNIPSSQPQNTIVSNYFVPTLTESLKDRNIRVVKGIVEEYHRTHTYSLSDMIVCGDMATDVWNMVKTQGINAVIYVGNVDKDITTIQEANHVWVMAETSPNEWLALETTGGFIACNNQQICSVNNPRYYKGWEYNNPKELKDALDDLKHPCPDGYILGSNEKCHQACGGSTYCTGDSVCINGDCRGCNPGYIFGKDLKCHQACGGGSTYCTGDSICVNGQCISCNQGYILGDDLKCHQPCGSTTTYCTGNSVCINGQCQGCNPGYYLGTDLRCHKS